MTTTPHTPGGTALLADRPVARIGYGAMQLATLPGRPAPDRDAATAVLRRARELGVNHIDTASFYGDAEANAAIRAALAPYPDDLVLVSKVGAKHGPDGLELAQKPAELRASVEIDLRSLGVERVDVVNLRRCDSGPGLVATGDQIVDLDDQLAELIALRDEGKIGAIGLSTVDADQVRRALPAGIACVQNAYSLLDRSGEPVLELCRDQDIAWAPYFPLGSAFAHIASVTEHPEVVRVAAEVGASPAQVGLAWLLAHDAHTLLIAGTTSVPHLDENVAAGDVVLDPDALAALDRITPAA